IGDEEVLIPERVDPGSATAIQAPSTTRSTAVAGLIDGGDDFAAFIETTAGSKRATLDRLFQWAKQIEEEGLIQLQTYHGKNGLVLLPRLRDEKVGLA